MSTQQGTQEAPVYSRKFQSGHVHAPLVRYTTESQFRLLRESTRGQKRYQNLSVGLHIIAGLSLLSNPYYLSTFSRELYLLSNPHNLSTYYVQDTVTVHATGLMWRRYLL
jgi:hypothetical protein